MCSVLAATFAKYGLNYGWDWPTSLTFGSMLSATDPVAVVRREPNPEPLQQGTGTQLVVGALEHSSLEHS